MESAPIKLPDALKSEHLTKGIKPIITCIGSYNDFGVKGISSIVDELSDEQPIGNHNVDYYEVPFVVEEKNFLGGGKTWTISSIDNLNKYSQKFFDCTGLVVTGKDRITRQNISFLSHQDPTKFLKTEKNKFKSHLEDRLTEIRDRCEKGTIDAVVVGGQYPRDHKDDFHFTNGRTRKNYLDAIKLISEEVQQVLGFEPVIINGPKLRSDFDNVFYDNKNRRLYFVRPEVNPDTGSFTNSDIDKEKNKWPEKSDDND
jgi:hypothetical protein